MIARKSGIRLLAGGIAMLYIISHAAAELPTVKEILEIHRANQAKLSQLHLQLVHTFETTEAACRAAQQRADQLEKSIEFFSNLTPEQIAELEIEVDEKKFTGEDAYNVLKAAGFGKDNWFQKNELKHLREIAKAWSRSVPMEIFLNGDDYQVRQPLRDPKTEAELERWSFPTVPLTTETLLAEYEEMRISSRSSTSTPPMRWWAGNHIAGHISSKHFGEINGAELPPYTNLLHPDWGNRHPIDTFFSSTEENYRVVKQEEIDGRLLTVVDALVSGEHEPRQLLRAWLDLSRGAVPVKLFENQVGATATINTFDEWKPSDFRGSHATTLTTQEIRELSNGGFYPVRTVREDWGRDADAPHLSEAEWAEVRAGQRDRPPSVMHRRYTWECALVEIKTDWDDGFFVIPFPEGQKIYDHDAGKVLGELDRKPLVKVGQPAPPLTVARWLDGKERKLTDLNGQVVVLDFWGLWCGPCRSSVPHLVELQAKFENQPVTFISIHSAENDAAALTKKIEAFAKERNWKFIAAIDAGRMLEDSVTATDYGVDSFPMRVIIGPDGKVVYVDPAADGPDCDEENPRVIAEFQKKLDAFCRERFEAVGETWPLAENLSESEQSAIYERVDLLYISQRIEKALQSARR